MTREEAIKAFEEIKLNAQTHLGKKYAAGCEGYYQDKIDLADAALSALRPVSREQVEKVWRGEWKHTHSSDNFWTEVWVCSCCGLEDDNGDCFDFCPSCGSPMTDEAVEMVMEKINNMEEMTNEH